MMIRIRKPQINEISKVTKLLKENELIHQQALPHIFCLPKKDNWYKSYLEKIFSDEQAFLLVAEEEKEKELVGLIAVWVRQSAEIPILVPRKFAVIDNLIVKKEFRRKGIGKKLVEAAEDYLRKQKVSLVELNVWEFNQKARLFYEKLNYQTVSRKMQKLLEEK